MKDATPAGVCALDFILLAPWRCSPPALHRTLAMISAQREAFLMLIHEISSELDRLGLHTDAAHARSYYRDVLRGVTPDGDPQRALQGHWTRARIVDWACILRIPPYQDAYPVRAREEARPCACVGVRGRSSTMFFPGGSKHSCGECGVTWLELDSRSMRRPA